MPRHVVKPGECLSLIAHQYGFADWETVYSHAQNKELRSKRPNPNLLYPGDVVFIPERQAKSARAATGQNHRFILKRPKPRLVVVLRAKGEPLANRTCEVEVDRQVETLTTDGDGRLEVPLHPATGSVRLNIEGHDEELVLKLGHLDPITELSGVQGRLLALGFHRQALDGKMGPATRRALRDFQRSSGLKPSGEPDADTQRALEKAYGGGVMVQETSTAAQPAGAEQEQVPKPGQRREEERPRKERVFVVARSVKGHEVVNTLDLSPHFEFSF